MEARLPPSSLESKRDLFIHVDEVRRTGRMPGGLKKEKKRLNADKPTNRQRPLFSVRGGESPLYIERYKDRWS